ncbi:MAG: hypothetical protein PHU40_12640 [Sulfurimonas sp.]|nr:hypothetical protein [Sulfurimonas sp.]
MTEVSIIFLTLARFKPSECLRATQRKVAHPPSEKPLLLLKHQGKFLASVYERNIEVFAFAFAFALQKV